MNNQQLAHALRCCVQPGGCNACPMIMDTTGCWHKLMLQAADALEQSERQEEEAHE